MEKATFTNFLVTLWLWPAAGHSILSVLLSQTVMTGRGLDLDAFGTSASATSTHDADSLRERGFVGEMCVIFGGHGPRVSSVTREQQQRRYYFHAQIRPRCQ